MEHFYQVLFAHISLTNGDYNGASVLEQKIFMGKERC